MSQFDPLPAPLDTFPAAALETAAGRVIPEWLDYNGHMNVAYYLLIFDRATDGLHALIGKTSEYIQRTQCSTFALEMHLTYLRELRLDDPYVVRTHLVDADHKRIHMLHSMYHAEEGWLAATNESLSMHIDLTARRSKPYPPELMQRVERLQRAHAGLSPAEHVGRCVGIRKKSS